MSAYPRVLHVGFQPIGSPTNSGLTLGSMFADWPQPALKQLCARRHPSLDPDPSVIFAPLSHAPIDGAIRSLLGSRVPAGAADGLNNSVGRSQLGLPLKTRARVAATTANDMGPVRLPRRMIDGIDKFRPEVIHSLLGGVRQMRLATLLSERFDVPLVPHFMDDWVSTLFTDGQLFGMARHAALRAFDDVRRLSSVFLVIGQDMKTEYERLYQTPCVVVGNSVNFAEYHERPVSFRTGRPVLRYVGGLHLGREEVLRRLCRAMVKESLSDDALFEIFVPPVDSRLAQSLSEDFEFVRYGGSLGSSDVPGALAAADGLVFIESPHESIATFTRFSVSTKVPQYLAARRPVLVVGPTDQGSVRELLRSSVGFWAGDGTNARRLIDAVREVLSSEGGFDNDLVDFEQRFGQEATRARLRHALEQAARGQT